MTVAVVTDTTHYLPADVVERYGIRLVSLYVSWQGGAADAETGQPDGFERESDMPDFDAFYDRLRSAAQLPTTSQPSVGDFLAVYEPLLEQEHDIVSIHLSGALSGTYSSALQAREQLEERGLADRVEVLDSATACGGLGMEVLAAAAHATAGASLQDVVSRAREARAALRLWFCVDTLEYLRRGGRIGKAQAWVGGALKVKPILSIESEILPVERVRTAGRAFERMVDYMRTLHEDGADGWVVQHIQARDQAERLVERGHDIFGCEPLFVSEVGPVIGAHAGPGMIGVGAIPTSLLA